MARTRDIKPSFFKNEHLAECDPLARLLFVGLWTIADRDGRIECRPLRIKAELFPYDSVDIVALLEQLRSRGFIRAYDVDGVRYIDIPGFSENQRVHPKEQSEGRPAWGDGENVDFHGEKCNAAASRGKPRQNSGAPVSNRALPSLPSLPSVPSLPSFEFTHTPRARAGEEFRQPGWAADEWAKFVEVWNRTSRATPWTPLTPPAGWVDAAAVPGWLDKARPARDRLPRCAFFSNPLAVTQFLADGYADRILAGEFDNARREPTRGGGPPAPMTLDEKIARDRKESRTKPAWRKAPPGCPDDLAGRFFNQMLSEEQFEKNLALARQEHSQRLQEAASGPEMVVNVKPY